MISTKTSHMPSEQSWCLTKARRAWWHSVAFDLKVHTQLALALMVARFLISVSMEMLWSCRMRWCCTRSCMGREGEMRWQ